MARKLDLEAVAAALDREAAEMCLGHYDIRIELEDEKDVPATMTPPDKGGCVIWVAINPDLYPALTPYQQEFTRRHELMHAYFCPFERIHERMLSVIKEHKPDLAEEFRAELGEAEEDTSDMLARAFCRRRK